MAGQLNKLINKWITYENEIILILYIIILHMSKLRFWEFKYWNSNKGYHLYPQRLSHIHIIFDSYNLTKNVSFCYLKDKEIEVQKDQGVSHKSPSCVVAQQESEPEPGAAPHSAPGGWPYHGSPTQPQTQCFHSPLGFAIKQTENNIT